MSVSGSGEGARLRGVTLVLLALAIGFAVLVLNSTSAGPSYAPAEQGTIPVGEIHAPANWLVPS